MTNVKITSFLLAIIMLLCFLVGCVREKPNSLQSDINSDNVSSKMAESEIYSSNTDESNSSSGTDISSVGGNTVTNSTPSQTIQNQSSANKPAIKNNCRLIVKGKDITDSTYVWLVDDPNYIPNRGRPQYRAALPVVAIMEALGARVQWNGNTTATITYNGEKYFLDIAKSSLKIGTDELLIGAPGGKAIIQDRVLDREIIVDEIMLLRFFQINGINHIRIDEEKMIINIY